MRVLFILLILLTSCKSNKETSYSFNTENLYDMTINEYKDMLINYNKNKDFPNIDK